MWRRAAIDAGGGWQHDTLTEDVDLSYRAQLAGWKFLYLSRVDCPAELPPEINAFKSQQHRWTKGSIQTAKKLLFTLLTARIPFRVKVEAFFHLTSPMCYLYITLMALLFYPAIFVNMQVVEDGSLIGLLLGMSLFALGTVSAGVFLSGPASGPRIAARSPRSSNYRCSWRSVSASHSTTPAAAWKRSSATNRRSSGRRSTTWEQERRSDAPGSATKRRRGGIKSKSEIRNRKSSIIPTPSIKVWMSLLGVGHGLVHARVHPLVADVA